MLHMQIRKRVRNNGVMYEMISIYRYLRYDLKFMKMHGNFKLKILDAMETSEVLSSSEIGFVRFGDSELKMLYRHYDIGFQKYDVMLASRLYEIINYTGDDIYIGLPLPLDRLDKFKFKVAMSWASYFVREYADLQTLHFPKNLYLDTQVTRSNEYADKSVATVVYKNLKKIWQNKRVLIVEGDQSRLGVGNDLFNNAQHVSRILVPSENAFDYYDEILATTIDYAESYDLVIAAIGPTTTVLGFDLRGVIKTFDLGHVDIQYEFILRNVSDVKSIPGKYTNESINKANYRIYDEKYESEVLKRIGV